MGQNIDVSDSHNQEMISKAKDEKPILAVRNKRSRTYMKGEMGIPKKQKKGEVGGGGGVLFPNRNLTY